jgi:hypothetical protein
MIRKDKTNKNVNSYIKHGSRWWPLVMSRNGIGQAEKNEEEQKEHPDHQSEARSVFYPFRDEISVRMFGLITTGTDLREEKRFEDARRPQRASRAIEGMTSSLLKKKLKLSSKQFYNRLSALINAGLVIKMSNGRGYNATTYGWTIFGALHMIDKASQNYWRLQFAETLARIKIDKDEYKNIMDSLLQDDELKGLSHIASSR